MIALLAYAALAGCHASPLTLAEAKQIVLTAPNIRASATQLSAKPFFEWIERAPSGWYFDINSATPCGTANPCSGLLGHYSVTDSGEVTDLDAGEDGVRVSSPAMRRLLRSLRRGRC